MVTEAVRLFNPVGKKNQENYNSNLSLGKDTSFSYRESTMLDIVSLALKLGVTMLLLSKFLIEKE